MQYNQMLQSPREAPKSLVFIAVQSLPRQLPHRLSVPHAAKSAFHGTQFRLPTTRRFKSPLLCSLPEEQGGSEEGGGEFNTPKYFVTYESWRNPRWLDLHQIRAGLVRESPALVEPGLPLFQLPKEYLALRVTCTLSLLSFLGLLSLAYVRLNDVAHIALKAAADTGLSRELHVGRVVRCNPFTGIRLLDVSLPPSPKNPSAPVVSVSQVDLKLSGFLRSIFTSRALRVDLRLDGAEIRVSQAVVNGPKNLPIGQWDPGIYSRSAGTGTLNQTSLSNLSRVLRFLQPGTLSIRNAYVYLQPADFQDYGHGDEVVEIEDARAEVTFPVFTITDDLSPLVAMDGDFGADVRGKPVDGGFIEVQCKSNGNKLLNMQPEDPLVNLRVAGEGVQASKVASFLNLPFRADDGVCTADVSMDFLYKSASLVPIMRGEALLESVKLRFHPDPKTPEFHNINGKLRFEGKTMFLDGPVGELGTLPMTVVGSIHLEDGYSLMGYARPVDVNNILDTFEVEKFVPVQGLVSGEAQMSGSLDEPVITGLVESASEDNVFDRLPIKNASLNFEWDAIAGLLRLSNISATVNGSGSVSGNGCMYFDMTKESPYGIRQPVHSSRSPKALYWNPDSQLEALSPLNQLPDDELEIDEQAPYRPYDSMRFDFKVVDAKGGDLLRYYGGEYGKLAAESIGYVSGEAVLAGHAKDANCRVLWRSTTPPPPIHITAPEPPDAATFLPMQGKSNAGGKQEVPSRVLSNTASTSEGDGPGDSGGEEQGRAGSMLGGGEFRGLIYLKLGDLPEARRVKLRTTVKGFDARRAGWADPQLRKALRNAPLLEASMDTFFKGVMFQRAIIPPGQTKVPRTPRMELLGADGALAVRKLTLNNVRFDKVMNGSFSFSTSDFSLSLKEVVNKPLSLDNQNSVQSEDEQALSQSLDELTLAASLKGKANLCFRRGKSEVIASVSKDAQDQQVAELFARNVVLQDIIGEDKSFSSGETLGGTFNADMNLNITSRTGEGSLSIDHPRMGSLNFSSISGHVVWRDQNVFMEKATVKYRRSEYQIDARYCAGRTESSDFGWEVNVNIPRASIRDVATLVQSGNSVATALQSPADKISQGRLRHSSGPAWIQRLAQSSAPELGTVLDEWSVPDGLGIEQEIVWFKQYLDDREDIMRRGKLDILDEAILESESDVADIQGNVTGRVTLKYDSTSGEERWGPANANALLQAILDQLTRTTFSFQLIGDDWRVGPAEIKRVDASGMFEDGVLNIGVLSFQGKDGFSAQAGGQITSSGSVNGSAFLKRAPAALVNKYGRAPINVTGECDARVEIEGNLSNPRAFGRAVWTGATLNGKQVKGAKTDMACVNGRCILNVDARIGGRRLSSEKQSDAAIKDSLNWGDDLVTGLRDLAAQADGKAEDVQLASRKSETRGLGEPVEVRVSAPVRFYLLKYLQRRAPSTFWSEVEPVLGGSLPSDDEWILMDVDVKKYGLVLLNTAFPELGWESGDSDIRLRVSGTLPNPVVRGRVSLADGRLSPKALSEPLHSLRGEVDINENGLISLKSVAGRCGGRGISVGGDMFLTEGHREQVSKEFLNNQAALEGLKPRDANTRKARRLAVARMNEAKSALQKGLKGVTLEFGEFPVNLQNIVLSKLSGKLRLAGTAFKPSVGGALTFSDGLIFLGNAGGPAQLPSASEIKAGTRLPMLSGSTNGNIGIGIRTGEGTSAEAGNGAVFGLPKRDAPTEIGNVSLNGLNINLGRDMQVVQPFVLNVDTAGSLRMDGSSSNPMISGEVKLLRGRVNILASRMSLRKDESNYIKFVKPDGGTQPGSNSGSEPRIKVSLEDQDLRVSISECAVSKWGDNIEVSDRSGNRIEAARIGELLGDIRSPEAVRRLLAGYVVNSIETGGKIGPVEWRVFPALVSRTGGLVHGRLQDELGVGASFEYGGISVSNSVSVSGTTSSKIGFRLWDWLNIEFGNEGAKNTRSFGIRLESPDDAKDMDDVEREKKLGISKLGAEDEKQEGADASKTQEGDAVDDEPESTGTGSAVKDKGKGAGKGDVSEDKDEEDESVPDLPRADKEGKEANPKGDQSGAR